MLHLLLVFIFSSIVIFCSFRRSNTLPLNWPFIGMLPMLVIHFDHIIDKVTEILEQNNNTFVLKGLWFGNMDKILTSDPANVQHVLSKCFSNYPKGLKSKRSFDVLGDVLFNSDLDEWRAHRKMARAFFNDRRFHEQTPKINQHVIEKGLIPVLEHASEQRLILDLQDLFHRLMFDSTCMMITGFDPASTRVGFPEVAFSEAIDDASEAIFRRIVLPKAFWGLQKWLGIGSEKKMMHARKTLDNIAAEYITRKQEQLLSCKDHNSSFDALHGLLTEDEVAGSIRHTCSTMRDAVVGLIFAGRDTAGAALTWFFWLVYKNPSVESKIIEEIKASLPPDERENENYLMFKTEEVNKLVYLHGAFCEALRLFPPAPFQLRESIQADILPSGHRVEANMLVVLSSYALGRMKSIWGEDCLEFKPERWISEKGGIKVEPSNKFAAFSSGPRICPGKELAFIRMKAIAAAIIQTYHVEVIKDHPVIPVTSIILQMKHGLKATVIKRSARF